MTDSEKIQLILDDIESRRDAYFRMLVDGADHLQVAMDALKTVTDYTISACEDFAEQERRQKILAEHVDLHQKAHE